MYRCYVQVLCTGAMYRCYEQVLCTGVMYRCYVQVLCTGVMYRCYVQIFVCLRVKAAYSKSLISTVAIYRAYYKCSVIEDCMANLFQYNFVML